MDGNRTAVSDRLAHWRGQQLDRHDPVQFAFLEALQRRAQLASGSLRGVLDPPSPRRLHSLGPM